MQKITTMGRSGDDQRIDRMAKETYPQTALLKQVKV
jgi:hypothetical protein